MTRHVTTMGWDNVPHLSEQAKADLLQGYPLRERDARTKGVPQLGSGAIYPVAEEDIVCEPFLLPVYCRHAYALDVGWNRTAAIWGALDPESDVLYLYSEHYRSEAEPPVHADAVKGRGAWIPGVIDPAARGRSQHDGAQLLRIYQGLLPKLSTANNAVEAGLHRVWMRMSSGRLKVFKHLQNWLMEYRLYRRDEKGQVVKQMDHLMDCTRYLEMSGLQLAAQRPREEWAGDRPGALPTPRNPTAVAQGYDEFGDVNRRQLLPAGRC